MRQHNHIDFILTPITNIVKDAISASIGIGDGIETYPLLEYMLQSVFLRMTGSQEQKMKCICWEIASNDYTYRYDRYSKNKLGECSVYNDKDDIYNDLLDHHCALTNIEKSAILNQTIADMANIIIGTNIYFGAQKNYINAQSFLSAITIDCFAGPELLCNKNHCPKKDNHHGALCMHKKNARKIYDILYNNRNKLAHNTQSYQHNLPTLNTLNDDTYEYTNYFIWFAVLILIDKIFIALFKQYLHYIDTEEQI